MKSVNTNGRASLHIHPDGALQPDITTEVVTTDSGNTICAGIIKDSHPPAVLDVGRPKGRPLINHVYWSPTKWATTAFGRHTRRKPSNYPSASDDCSTGTPGPIVEETEIFFR